MKTRRLRLPEALPFGYHRLAIETGHRRAIAFLISAPSRAWEGPRRADWGVFLPLYALRTERRPGLAAYGDLEVLFEWAHRRGSRVVATLPFLARVAGADSPYSPSSRRFWDEIFVAPDPELALRRRPSREPAARRPPLLDWRAEEDRVRRELGPAAERLFREGGRRLDDLEAFRRRKPDLSEYARFCAARTVLGDDWRAWPARARSGRIVRGDFRDEDFRYHLFAQWAADRQVESVHRSAEALGQTLLLDLPFGVDARGFDVWREPDLFALGVASGAPPDAFNEDGQNWGMPPVVPASSRRQGHAHLAQAVVHHLRHAGGLRVDHAIGIHRAFWIPSGFSARDGVFVKWPAEEIYAVLSLESHRHRARIVGEDLGVVPPAVRAGMRRHGIGGLYVLPFEIHPGGDPPAHPPGPRSVASLGTHDTYPFAAIWSGDDIADRVRLGQLSPAETPRERRERQRFRRALLGALQAGGAIRRGPRGVEAVLAGALAFLGKSPTSLVLVNLEDLWLETDPQNVPGARRPNWRRRARYTIEELSGMRSADAILRVLDAARRGEEKTWPKRRAPRRPGASASARRRPARARRPEASRRRRPR